MVVKKLVRSNIVNIFALGVLISAEAMHLVQYAKTVLMELLHSPNIWLFQLKGKTWKNLQTKKYMNG